MTSGTQSLRRQSLLVAAGVGAGLAAAGAAEPRWLVGSLLVWAYCFAVLFRGLGDNRAPGRERPFPTLGVATWVTVFRSVLVAIAAGFLLLPAPPGRLGLVPAAAYSLASLLDHVDGRLARALGRATRLGERLDMEVDAAGILVAALLGIHYGKLPLWYASIGLARYLFVAGLRYRAHRGRPVAELDPSHLRRWLAGTQMGFLSVALWPPIPATWSLLLAPLFGGASLVMFARDWAVVSTRRPPRRT